MERAERRIYVCKHKYKFTIGELDLSLSRHSKKEKSVCIVK